MAARSGENGVRHPWGDCAALDQLISPVHDELSLLVTRAGAEVAAQPPTAVVNEAYVRLFDRSRR